jgi:8-oxo-dGTP diphosphatase
MTIGHFLGGVGALVWDPSTNKYLLMQRSEHKDFERGAWECVTGRVDQGEGFEQAMRREVREEIGAEVQIEFFLGTTHFYRGEERPENELLGVIYGCTLKDLSRLTFNDEHCEARWVTAQEAFAWLPEDHWLRTVISRAEMLRTLLPTELREYYRQNSFEI